jgi:hypothetical protein
MSTSSLVSFSKREITEEIPGMVFGIYHLQPAKSVNEPYILHVEDSYYYKPDLDGVQDKVLVRSDDIVNSLAHMHTTSQLLARADQHPAVLAFPGEMLDNSNLFKIHKPKIEIALKRQMKWFEALVRLADDDWQQLRRHRMISDVQRTAAKELGLEREWLDTVYDESKSACPFCGSDLLDSNAPICPHCGKVHNPGKLKELEERLNPTSKVK